MQIGVKRTWAVKRVSGRVAIFKMVDTTGVYAATVTSKEIVEEFPSLTNLLNNAMLSLIHTTEEDAIQSYKVLASLHLNLK